MNQYSEYVRLRKIDIRNKLLEKFSNRCYICGYNKYKEVLEFHHIIPDEKEFGIGFITSKSLENIVKEIKKCILVCSNCHREIHLGVTEFNVPMPPDIRVDELRRRRKYKEEDYICECGNKKHKQSNVCRECWSFSQRKVERPSKEKLQEMMKWNTWTGIGREYGVSDNAVRKWAKKYELI